MLPACSRNPHDLKVFNQEEEIEYFKQNSKYIKRYRKDQQELINKISALRNEKWISKSSERDQAVSPLT